MSHKRYPEDITESDDIVSVVNFPSTQEISSNDLDIRNLIFAGDKVDVSGSTVAVSSAPLPTGAATESTLSSLNTKIPLNLTTSSTRLLTDGSGVTQPISGTVGVNNFPTSYPTPMNYVVLQGDAFVTFHNQTLALLQEYNVILVRNPSESGKQFRLARITTATSGSTTVTVRIYKTPTITGNGSAKTLSNLLVGSSDVSAMDVRSGYTTSSAGTQLISRVSGNDTLVDFDGNLVLLPGNDLNITMQPSGLSLSVDVCIEWYEV